MPKNVGDLGKFIVAKGFEKLPKFQKSPNLVTLAVTQEMKDVSAEAESCCVYVKPKNIYITCMA